MAVSGLCDSETVSSAGGSNSICSGIPALKLLNDRELFSLLKALGYRLSILLAIHLFWSAVSLNLRNKLLLVDQLVQVYSGYVKTRIRNVVESPDYWIEE